MSVNVPISEHVIDGYLNSLPVLMLCTWFHQDDTSELSALYRECGNLFNTARMRAIEASQEIDTAAELNAELDHTRDMIRQMSKDTLFGTKNIKTRVKL